MNRTERLYQIDYLLSSRRIVTREIFMEHLEVSWSTLKRDLAYLRDRMNAPIIFDAIAGGYRFDVPQLGPKYELPGLWFNADEVIALLSLHRLLIDLEPSLLGPHVLPLLTRLESIAVEAGTSLKDLSDRIRLSKIGTRKKSPEIFGVVSKAMLDRYRIKVTHFHRERGEETIRVLSPQRLTYYRNNWYLEAWCHERTDLRGVSLDALRSIEVHKTSAKNCPREDLDAVFGDAYGIYSGKAENHAVIRFSPEAAKWVADEEWHVGQSGYFDDDGFFILTIPYSKPNELIMDILRHGSNAEVIEPASLRRAVLMELEAMVIPPRHKGGDYQGKAD